MDLVEFAKQEGFETIECGCRNPHSGIKCNRCGGYGVVFEMHGEVYDVLFLECCYEDRINKEKENATRN